MESCQDEKMRGFGAVSPPVQSLMPLDEGTYFCMRGTSVVSLKYTHYSIGLTSSRRLSMARGRPLPPQVSPMSNANNQSPSPSPTQCLAARSSGRALCWPVRKG